MKFKPLYNVRYLLPNTNEFFFRRMSKYLFRHYIKELLPILLILSQDFSKNNLALKNVFFLNC